MNPVKSGARMLVDDLTNDIRDALKFVDRGPVLDTQNELTAAFVHAPVVANAGR